MSGGDAPLALSLSLSLSMTVRGVVGKVKHLTAEMLLFLLSLSLSQL
jgi:hypothetical protein